jgi:SLOG family YspA-like protein
MIVVCGSRGFTDYAIIRRELATLLHHRKIIHGGANGADSIAGEVATGLGFEVEVMKAEWDKYGRRAGYLRNIAMLDRDPAAVIAFWDGQSKGTAHTIREAEKRGIPVVIVRS